MTRSEFVKRRCEPLVRMIKPLVHEEMRDKVDSAVKLFILELIVDYEHLSSTDISELKENDFGSYGDSPLDT